MGNDNAQAFLKQWQGIPGRDFAKWLNEQPERSPDDIMADAMRIQAEDEETLAARGISVI